MPLSHYTMFSRSKKNTSQSKEETDNMPTDKTEQVTSGMKQGLIIIYLFFLFLRNSNNKYHFVPL